MANRHRDAVYIQHGASNPSGVCKALDRALAEVREEGKDMRTDAACRLIAHQLAHLMGVAEIEIGNNPLLYSKLMDECEEISGVKL